MNRHLPPKQIETVEAELWRLEQRTYVDTAT